MGCVSFQYSHLLNTRFCLEFKQNKCNINVFTFLSTRRLRVFLIQCITTTPKTNYTLLYFFIIRTISTSILLTIKCWNELKRNIMRHGFNPAAPMFHIQFYNSCLLNAWSYKQLSIKNAFWPRYFKHLWNAWHRLAVLKYGNRLNKYC